LLLFDQEERGPDDTLKLHFEAIRQFDEDDRHIIEGLLEAMILKHQNKHFFIKPDNTAATQTVKAVHTTTTEHRSKAAKVRHRAVNQNRKIGG